jgi:molybdopterin synthase catalytic subunit
MSFSHSHSIETRTDFEGGYVALTYDTLDVSAITASIADPSAGAQTIFIGTTRNSFNGKPVIRLEYHAYSSLAVNTILKILQSVHQSAVDDRIITRCAVVHRLGCVPIGEASVVVAVSSPHRRESFHACEKILEELKSKAQIWKKEFYAEGTAVIADWKWNITS